MNEVNKICRACLAENVNMFNLFTSSDPGDISLADMLMSCSLIKVDSKETLPDMMCAPCIKILTQSYNFKKQCEQSDKLLRSVNNKVQVFETVDVQEHKIDYEDSVSMEDRKIPEQTTLENEANEDQFLCDIKQEVEENFSYSNEFTSDVKIQNIVEKFICHLCTKTFSKHENLRDHMITHNNVKESLNYSTSCQTYEDLLSHTRQHNRLFKCPHCDKKFRTSNSLNGHVRIHCTVSESCNENTGYMCEAINGYNEELTKTKARGEALQAVEEIGIEHTEVEVTSFKCQTCGYCFIKKGNLIEHMKTHKPDHECSMCNLKFSEYSHLVHHNRISHSIFSCKICTKQYPTLQALSGHMRHHSNINGPCKLYKCTINSCTRLFSSSEHLRRHKIAHNRSNNVYLCNLCGKTFNSGSAFNYHLKMHSKRRYYNCKLCGARFIKYTQLRQHIDDNCSSNRHKILSGQSTVLNHNVMNEKALPNDIEENETILIMEEREGTDVEVEEEEVDEEEQEEEEEYAYEEQKVLKTVAVRSDHNYAKQPI